MGTGPVPRGEPVGQELPRTGLGALARPKRGTGRAGCSPGAGCSSTRPGSGGAGARAVALPLGHGVGKGSPSASVSPGSANGHRGNGARGGRLALIGLLPPVLWSRPMRPGSCLEAGKGGE